MEYSRLKRIFCQGNGKEKLLSYCKTLCVRQRTGTVTLEVRKDLQRILACEEVCSKLLQQILVVVLFQKTDQETEGQLEREDGGIAVLFIHQK